MVDGKEPKKIKMGAELNNEKIITYSELVKEYKDVFVWSYKDFKTISLKVTQYWISLIFGAIPIRQKGKKWILYFSCW